MINKKDNFFLDYLDVSSEEEHIKDKEVKKNEIIEEKSKSEYKNNKNENDFSDSYKNDKNYNIHKYDDEYHNKIYKDESRSSSRSIRKGINKKRYNDRSRSINL